jgi:hypothetical protein
MPSAVLLLFLFFPTISLMAKLQLVRQSLQVEVSDELSKMKWNRLDVRFRRGGWCKFNCQLVKSVLNVGGCRSLVELEQWYNTVTCAF